VKIDRFLYEFYEILVKKREKHAILEDEIEILSEFTKYVNSRLLEDNGG
jgi:hypothetical protein